MDREFKELVDAFTTGHQINWLTTPPRTPQFGGFWKTAIKSMKSHFYRTMGTKKVSFEIFTTLITKIEALLNSRPLTAPSSDANDSSALTPAHFLIERPLTVLPEASQEDNRTLNRRFKSINNNFSIFRQFGKRGPSTTWKHFNIDQNGRITSNSTPPLKLLWSRKTTRHQCYGHWQIITKFFDGNEKTVRVVLIRTQTGLYVRAVSRLVQLEKEKEESQLPKWKTADDSMEKDWQVSSTTHFNPSRTEHKRSPDDEQSIFESITSGINILKSLTQILNHSPSWQQRHWWPQWWWW